MQILLSASVIREILSVNLILLQMMNFIKHLCQITYLVLLQGQRVPILGRVCMDQFMIDVTDLNLPVCVGDIVTLIGKDDRECITMEELGKLSGRFNYELVCDIGKRIPRIYKQKDTIICE